MQKICYNLYRVSSPKQLYRSVDNKDDIPMQRKACREFADKMGWVVGAEFEEKGVSGSKISANNRDAIIDLKDAAKKGEFQVLLVFMFDRLGRIDDETPFVLEWFVKNGIKVWSVNEGEQKIEQHVDKLLNYIRFWQAAGESEKTSIRTKTRLGQIVQEGHFRGGIAPFGYRLEKQGRVNKGNHEVYEIVIDEHESIIVCMIFDLCVNKGYGSQRITNYLYKQGVKNRKGDNFVNCTIYHMLKNKTYIGVLKSGETESEVLTHLQIIDVQTFETAQNQLLQRSKEFKERCVPLNTTGKSLLSGNIFCGHCEGRLIVTTNGKKYHKADGNVTITPRMRYICYNRTRHPYMCDGQSGYTAKKVDAIIDTVVRDLLKQINDIPREALIIEKYTGIIADYQKQLTSAKVCYQKCVAEVMEYESEVIKVIRNESKLNPELLNKLYDDAKTKASNAEKSVIRLEEKIQDSVKLKDTLYRQYMEIQSWADVYNEIDNETKKMIVSKIIKRVFVKRNYEIEIEFNANFEKINGIDCWNNRQADINANVK